VKPLIEEEEVIVRILEHLCVLRSFSEGGKLREERPAPVNFAAL
jgi:hypothetical protein